ncbi:MAG: hypothetical protein U0572_14995 [Phycisphaerales bacterium]
MSTPHELPAEPIDSRAADGLDATAWGRDLDVTIRIARDGRVYFHDLPADMIDVARALCPLDPELARRATLAARMLDAARSPASPHSPHSKRRDQDRSP